MTKDGWMVQRKEGGRSLGGLGRRKGSGYTVEDVLSGAGKDF